MLLTDLRQPPAVGNITAVLGAVYAECHAPSKGQ